MKSIFHKLLTELENNRQPVLATIISTKGSTPQVPGASALFSESGLLAGTLGGGILEGDASRNAAEVIEKSWLEGGLQKRNAVLDKWEEISDEMASSLEKGICIHIKRSDSYSVFLEPVYPLQKTEQSRKMPSG